jgi:hypothetical protein
MVKSIPWGLKPEHIDVLGKLVMNTKDIESDHYCFKMKSDITASSEIDPCLLLVINEAKLTKEERDRLDHWRHAHRSSSGERFKERCHTCEQAKHKAVFRTNDFFKGTTTSTEIPYFRLYADAYIWRAEVDG